MSKQHTDFVQHQENIIQNLQQQQAKVRLNDKVNKEIHCILHIATLPAQQWTTAANAPTTFPTTSS